MLPVFEKKRPPQHGVGLYSFKDLGNLKKSKIKTSLRFFIEIDVFEVAGLFSASFSGFPKRERGAEGAPWGGVGNQSQARADASTGRLKHGKSQAGSAA